MTSIYARPLGAERLSGGNFPRQFLKGTTYLSE